MEPTLPRRRSQYLAMAAIVAAVLLVGAASQPACVQAQSASCRSICLAQYNQCRIATKGSSSCDRRYQACLQRCVSRR
jgi:hypothetical protein